MCAQHRARADSRLSTALASQLLAIATCHHHHRCRSQGFRLAEVPVGSWCVCRPQARQSATKKRNAAVAADDEVDWPRVESMLAYAQSHGIFLIFRGLLDERREVLSEWLMDPRRRNQSALISGRTTRGRTEQSIVLNDYAGRMEGYVREQRPWDGSLGAFALKKPSLIVEDMAWLESHPVLSKYLPWGSRGKHTTLAHKL